MKHSPGFLELVRVIKNEPHLVDSKYWVIPDDSRSFRRPGWFQRAVKGAKGRVIIRISVYQKARAMAVRAAALENNIEN